MTPIARSSCPDFLLPYLVDVPAVEFLTREHVENFLRNRSGLPPSISGLHKSLRSLLSETFLSRCCYCEAYADTSNGVIERFRPKGGRQGKLRIGIFRQTGEIYIGRALYVTDIKQIDFRLRGSQSLVVLI